MISVVIPAHDEERTIGPCLEAVLRDAAPDEIEVIVVCNGCTDRTGAIAEEFGPPVTVLTTPVASKVVALNLGDEIARGFPRFYVDADTKVELTALRAVTEVLSGTRVKAASPSLMLDLSGSSRAVCRYYRFWSALPSVRDDIVGRGVYGLSRSGRASFDRFPPVIADDHFVRTVILPEARISVTSCHSLVRAPADLRALVRRSVRVYAGNMQVDPHRRSVRHGWTIVLRNDPARFSDLPVFGFVAAVAKAQAWWCVRRGRMPGWGRDNSRGASSPSVAGGHARNATP